MLEDKEYNIGLDIGVGSVGWCVIDNKDQLIRYKGKNLWGSRIFKEAEPASVRRAFRSSKRRLNRRNERIKILQSLLLDDMEKEYPNFFSMLKESSLTMEDKKTANKILGIKYNLFSEDEFTDKDYFNKFKTIYHLRNYLCNETEKVDFRLVYLAIHHIIKYRGNFLHETDFSSNTQEVEKSIEVLLKFLNNVYAISFDTVISDFTDILKNKNITKSEKKDEIKGLFTFDNENKQVLINVINAILGYSFDINKIFNSEFEKNKYIFSKEIDDEESILNELGEYFQIYEALKNIYSWFILQEILGGNKLISEAFIKKYENYGKDLNTLKLIYKKYLPSQYSAMFRKYEEDNYVSYNGKEVGKKKCDINAIYKRIKKDLDKFKDQSDVIEIINKIDNGDFLIKLNVTDNGAIPHQLHFRELELILDNQSKYYSSLAENKEKIKELFNFRIPYYVGPLANGKDEEDSNRRSKWAWLVRNNEEKIRPWNFSEVINEDETAEKFIRGMTNKCTYLINEDVIPRNSILYSRFCVLNELNNIKVNGKHIASDFKKKIIEEIFEKKKKVSKIDIIKFYNKNGFNVESFSGLSDGENFTSNLASSVDMINIFGKITPDNIDEIENIIYWITIFEEKKVLKRKIEKEYGEKSSCKNKLSEQTVNQLVKLNYSGWSRLSKKLLMGLKSEDGKNDTIIEKMEKSNLNFMQIINSEEFGFNKQIEKLMPPISKELKYDDVNEIPTSPANKRAIWQTLLVVKEIVKVMKHEPRNIYIEFARREDDNKKLKDNRAKQLMKKYEEISAQVEELKNYDSNVYLELKKHQNDEIINEKLFLYFIQNGKCMYSGKPLNIDELGSYEVDHIIPRSYIKDDSISNKALVIRSENQRKKDSLLLDDNIINARINWWRSLLNNGLIDQSKFNRLTRRKMFETDEDMERFVQRQLVETRQITKYVTNILKNKLENVSIYSIRAELTSGFREKYGFYKNRNINNSHHAKDAYIISIIGNLFEKDWKNNDEFKYGKYVKKYLNDERTPNEKHGMIMGFINKRVNIDNIRKTMNYKDYFFSRMLEEGTGEFYKQTLYSPKDAKNKPVIKLKQNRDCTNYGGYSGEQKAYLCLFKYFKGNKENYGLIGIPINVSYNINSGKTNELEYITNLFPEYNAITILKNKILMNQEYLDEENNLMRFCSDTEIRSSKELKVNEEAEKFIYFLNNKNDKDIEYLNDNFEKIFNYLIEKIQKQYKCFDSISNRLVASQDKFSSLEFDDKKQVINGLVDLMETGQGNLKCLGLSDRTGRKSGQKFDSKKIMNMTFINKSVTGIYESRYSVNGI